LPDLFTTLDHYCALNIDSNYACTLVFPHHSFIDGFRHVVYMQDSSPAPFLFLVVGEYYLPQ